MEVDQVMAVIAVMEVVEEVVATATREVDTVVVAAMTTTIMVVEATLEEVSLVEQFVISFK